MPFGGTSRRASWPERDALVRRIAKALGVSQRAAMQYLVDKNSEINEAWVRCGGNWGDVALKTAVESQQQKQQKAYVLTTEQTATEYGQQVRYAGPRDGDSTAMHHSQVAELLNQAPGPVRYRVHYDPSVHHSEDEWELHDKLGEFVRAFQEAVVLRIDGREHCLMWMDVEREP